MHFASLALLGAMLPIALGMLQEGDAASNKPTGTASLINAVATQYLLAIPKKEDAKPCAADATVRRVHPEGRRDLCLTVQGGELTSGAEIGIHYCAAKDDEPIANWQLWDIRGAHGGTNGGQIKSNDAKLCLSVGSDLENAARPHPEKCFDEHNGANENKSQTWTLTAKGIRSMKSNKCVDIRADSFPYTGTKWNSLRDVQVWDCANDKENVNPQQIWTLMDPNGGTSGSIEKRKRALGRRSRP